MRFSPNLIERLRSHFLMSEVISRRMQIKKHGREYHGLCPFHNEKSPSFTVNDEKGFFHCFGCAAHGDAIEFVRRFDRLSYPEAVESLARDAGIEIAKQTPDEQRKVEQEKTLYDVLEIACQWFEKQLLAPSGMLAKDYIDNRGVRAETIRQFRIGYAPEDRTGLYQHLTQAGFSQAMQAEAGLIFVSESSQFGGGVYDRFRGRLIFPIRNASGKVVAFGGRLIASNEGNKSLPKYLNSPETPLFKKGELLYNFDQAKRPARDGNIVVVMEGYMDVVMSSQAGVAYGVATLGTAVTPEHLRLLWQVAKEPILCLDGDAAGKRAMLRSAEVALPLLKPSYSLRYAVLPQGEDPDSYVQKHGKASFEKVLLASRRLSQILWDTLLPQYKLDLPEGRAALDDACRKLSAKIADDTVKQHYLTYFRKQLWSQQATVIRQKPDEKRQKPENRNQSQTRSPHIEHMIVQHHSAALESVAGRLLNILLQFPQLLHKSNVEETLSRLDIRTTSINSLRNVLLLAAANVDVNDRELFIGYVQQQLDDNPASKVFAENMKLPYPETLTEHDASLLWNEAIATYEIAHLEYEFKELQECISGSMNEADYQRMIELQNAVQQARSRRSFAPAESDVA